MTFERMEQLKGMMITLELAFRKYNWHSDIKQIKALMKRLALDFDVDDKIESECVRFLDSHSELMKKFDTEAS